MVQQAVERSSDVKAQDNYDSATRLDSFTTDLTLDNGDVDVTLVHVRMLVDVFSARYTWDGPYLRFIDEERRTFYRVRFADPPAPARQSGTPDGGMG